MVAAERSTHAGELSRPMSIVAGGQRSAHLVRVARRQEPGTLGGRRTDMTTFNQAAFNAAVRRAQWEAQQEARRIMRQIELGMEREARRVEREIQLEISRVMRRLR